MENLLTLGSIELKGESLQIEPFIANIKTITLKGVPPHLSEKEVMIPLSGLGKVIRPLEKITYTNLPKEFSHVFSFSRKITIQVKNPNDIPHSISVTDSGGRSFNIFLEHGPRKCRTCGSTKHPASKCNAAAGSNPRPQENKKADEPKPINSLVHSKRFQDLNDFDSESGPQSDGVLANVPRRRKKRTRKNGTTPPSTADLEKQGIPTESEHDFETETEADGEIPSRSQASSLESPSGRIQYDFSHVELNGPIDNQTLRLLLEDFIKKKSYAPQSYSSLLSKYKISHQDFRLMLTKLKQEVPTKDFLSKDKFNPQQVAECSRPLQRLISLTLLNEI